MIRTVTIPLDDDLVPSIAGPLASGRSASAAELFETCDALRTALIAGEASGPFEDFETDGSWRRRAAR